MRWTICALLFFATTINYLDRQTFSVLVPIFEKELRLGPNDLAAINVAFLLTYGIGMVVVGQIIDRVGTKVGLAVTFLLWSLASVAHGLVSGLGGFLVVRGLLGLGEAGNFPATVRAVAEWFPAKERALATGWFNSGTNIGAILAPILAVALAHFVGWRTCFVLLGLAGLVWLVFWLRGYFEPARHPSLSQEERAYIEQDGGGRAQANSYSELLATRPIYGLGLAKFFTDAPWWFYLTWLPKLLVDHFRLSPGFMAIAIPVVYIVSDGGSVAGGWLSSSLMGRGWNQNRARKTAMLTCALCTAPIMLMPLVLDRPSGGAVYAAVALVAVAAAAHQGWSCNLFTLASDIYPTSAVSKTVGLMTLFGATGGALFQVVVARALTLTGSYDLPFMLAGVMYLVGLGVLHLIAPSIRPVLLTRRNPHWVTCLEIAAIIAVLIGLQVVLIRR